MRWGQLQVALGAVRATNKWLYLCEPWKLTAPEDQAEKEAIIATRFELSVEGLNTGVVLGVKDQIQFWVRGSGLNAGVGLVCRV